MKKSIISWSNHKLEASLECGRKLGYMLDKVRPDVTFPYFAEGSFLHTRIEKFYDDVVKWKVKSDKGYAGKCAGIWHFSVVLPNKSQGLKIEWRQRLNERGEWEEDPDESHIRRANVKKSGLNIYNEYFGKEPPLKSEFPFDIILEFRLGERRYTIGLNGRIDELRRPLTIRETKTGFEEPSIQEYHHGRQVAFYVLGALNDLVNNPDNIELASRFGITDDIRKRLREDPLDVDGIVRIEYFLTRTGLFKPVERTKEHLYSLLEDVIRANEKADKADFKPNPGRHCKGCKWKYKCFKEGGGVSETIGGERILFLNSAPTVHIANIKLKRKRKKPQKELLPFRADPSDIEENKKVGIE